MSALTIGLTGGVAAGKTHVARLFIEHGVPLLEADDVAREVVALGSPGLAAIESHFGSDVLLPDGTLDRRTLRERIFNDASVRRELEAITHPLIRSRVAAWRDTQTDPYCVYGAAILIETGMFRDVDRVLVVDAPAAVQLRRVQARDRIEPALAQQMIAVQASQATRLAHAHDVLDNHDERRSVLPQWQRLDRLYRELAAGRTDKSAD